MAHSNAATARALYEAWERRDFGGVVENMTDDVAILEPAGNRMIVGKDDVKAFYASWATACPDSTCGFAVVATSDDTVAVEGVWVGTNTGPFGDQPATGRSVSMPWVNVLRFDPQGRISGGNTYANLLPVMIGLGHLEPVAGS
jgi:steroid delta-isomerase-like uncharacterized protein